MLYMGMIQVTERMLSVDMSLGNNMDYDRIFMLHPHTEVRFVSSLIGNGVFATQLIPRGTITWVHDKLDRAFDESTVRSFEPAYQEVLERYSFRNNSGKWIFCWDNTRYINHSFRANTLPTPYGCEIAVRDIQAGEQVTNDYGCFNIIEPFECFPEEGCARTCVMPDDLLTYAKDWDKLLFAAYPNFIKNEQPLARLLSDDKLKALQKISRGDEQPLSISNCYFNPLVHTKN
jgi:uncharacterized protein